MNEKMKTIKEKLFGRNWMETGEESWEWLFFLIVFILFITLLSIWADMPEYIP